MALIGFYSRDHHSTYFRYLPVVKLIVCRSISFSPLTVKGCSTASSDVNKLPCKCLKMDELSLSFISFPHIQHMREGNGGVTSSCSELEEGTFLD